MKEIKLIWLLIFVGYILYGKEYTISGFIKSKDNNEPVLFATCVDTLSNTGVLSNEYGYFNLVISGKKATIRVSHVSYEPQIKEFELTKDTLINIFLETIQIDEIKITNSLSIHEQTLMGKITLSAKELKAVPSFIGEPDPIKAVTVLPGITSGKEGASGFYVRGGERDQNLILLDGTPLYNITHFGNFLSLINTDIIKNIDLYKGGFPARFGGRISSVMDITTKDGNNNNRHAKFSVGLINSSLLFEGPLNNKTSYIIAARSSYFDLFTIPLSIKHKGERDRDLYNFSILNYTFYDLNIKLTHQINNKNKISLSLYNGSDFYRITNESKTTYQEDVDNYRLTLLNSVFSLKHLNYISPKLFWVNQVLLNNYNNINSSKINSVDRGTGSSYFYSNKSNIIEYSCKSYIDLSPNNNNRVKSGIQLSKLKIIPGNIEVMYKDVVTNIADDTSYNLLGTNRGYQLDFFLEDELKLSPKSYLNCGIRWSNYIADKRYYSNPEPRLSFRWSINENISFKTGYSVMYQYTHALINNASAIQNEVWLISTENVPPQKAGQFAVGVFGKIPFSKIEYGIELYYKLMKNLINYRYIEEGEELINWENIIAKSGTGRSFGTEFYLKYTNNRLNSTLSYTWSKSERRFKELNNGLPFPFIFDKRHDLNLICGYQLNDNIFISTAFYFNTGIPFTLPEVYIQPNDYFYGYYAYKSINNRRLPPYHRMDILLRKKGVTKKGRVKYINFNIYNLYARQNAMLIYLNDNKVMQKSLYSIIPTINYTVEF